MNFIPHKYQQRAIDWIMDHTHCGLFLDMGLGKTVITLTAIQRLIDYGEVEAALVVAPKKVAETTWTAEASKWSHLSGLRVSRVMGTPAQRAAALDAAADVYVIGRDSIAWLVAHCGRDLPFDMIILDELTSFKSRTSKRFKAVRALRPYMSRIVGLTGTPAPNGYLDLWAQMYCLDGGERLGRFLTRYRDTYFDVRLYNHIAVNCTLKPGAADIIKDKISDICLSMSADDYLNLPDMITVDHRFDLPPAVLKKYRQFERERVMELAASDDALTADNAAALLNKLSQFANGAVYDADGVAHPIHDEKLDLLAEIIECSGDNVLVFYQYQHDRDRIMSLLSPSHIVRLYENEDTLRKWNAGKIDVLLAHPASTAYGLNLQAGGHTIVWFGTGWNLEQYLQANARLHRQGQSHPVVVHRLIAKDTADEAAVAALGSKAQQQKKLLNALKDLITKYIKNGKK